MFNPLFISALKQSYLLPRKVQWLAIVVSVVVLFPLMSCHQRNII